MSQHLKVLRESGFAKVRPDAQRRLYSVDAAGLQAVVGVVTIGIGTMTIYSTALA